MAGKKQNSSEEVLIAAPVIALQEIGGVFWNFLREVGSMFWFIAHTFEETIERLRDGRAPFRAVSFFRHAERAGVESVPLVALVSFFLGLTMALLTGYQLQRFGTERLIPGLVSIAFPYFLDLVRDSLLIRDLITGVFKSFMFGLLIAAIACYRGLSVKGGAAGVGTATTSSVVTAITVVIGVDTLYNIVYVNFFPTCA